MSKIELNDGNCELVSAICEKYGFPFDAEDLNYDENGNVVFTPFDGNAGIVCYYGGWELIGFNRYSLGLLDMDRDLDMFDEISTALA